MSDFEEKLILALKEKRARLGLSIRALAGTVGVSFSTLARVERGDGVPDNNSKIRLLEWLGKDANDFGLEFQRAALVHFRAQKNIQSGTVQALLKAADFLKAKYGKDEPINVSSDESASDALSKERLEKIAEDFRRDLNLAPDAQLDPLRLIVRDVTVYKLTTLDGFDPRVMQKLRDQANDQWSAMSVPLNAAMTEWAILLNDRHDIKRQKVTLLEEYWHIFLGHRLTKVSKVAEVYGRTYDEIEEHDAYYLASATLLPQAAIQKAVRDRQSAEAVAAKFGTSTNLVEYRIKRLGLWRAHTGKEVTLQNSD